MSKHFLKLSSLSLIIMSALSVISCKQENDHLFKNTLIANAGEDVVERNDTEIELDGSASRDTENKEFSYQWQVIEKPVNASAGLENDESAEAIFIGNLAGQYQIKLTIYNASFQSSDTVNITLLENSLLADAGEDKSVEVDTEVMLDGSASEDLEGDEFEIEWSVESAPESSSTSFTNEESLTPLFEANTPGEYQIKLTISNDLYESIDIVVVTVTEVNETIIIDETINEDRTLANIFNDEQADYIIASDISVNAKLTLEAGTILQFENGATLSIESSGTIVAVGEAGNPIVFKGETEGVGKWRSIKVYSNNNENRFEHVIIDGAGSGQSLDGINAGLSLINAKMSIVNTEFRNINGYGLYVREGSEILTFENNNFNTCSQAGLRTDAQNVSKLDKATAYSAGNGRHGIEVYTSGVDGEMPHTWNAPSDESAYVILNGLSIETGWIIEGGTIFHLSNNNHIAINSGGYIQALGTESANVQFISKPNDGSWRGITIYSSNETNQFNYTRFINAGNTAILSGIKAAVAMWGTAKAKFTNSTFYGNQGYGLYVQDGTEITAFSNNHFGDNTLAGILINPDNVKQLDAESIFSDNNGINAVEIFSGSIESGVEATWKGFADNTPYRIKGDMSVEIGWHIMPGAHFMLGTDVHIAINSGDGFIHAVGTQDKNITFTGFAEQAGAWQGIILYSNNVMNTLKHVEIKNGGSSAILSGVKANVALFGGTRLKIENCSLSNNPGYGLYVGGNVEINEDFATVNIFSDNALGEYRID